MFHRIKQRIFDDKRSNSVVSHLRRRRFAVVKVMVAELSKPARILDVGGTEWFWRTMGMMPDADHSITLLNLMKRDAESEGFACRVGDGCDMHEIEENAFDLVVSNSVIEHVGDFDRQEQFADEVQRVGRRYYVQTPNRWFPIEAHSHLPFFYEWPLSVKGRLLALRNVGVFPKQESVLNACDYLSEVRLLTKKELKALFPASRVLSERIVGLSKSYAVIG